MSGRSEKNIDLLYEEYSTFLLAFLFRRDLLKSREHLSNNGKIEIKSVLY
jgi:hypothetical protein